MRPVSRILLKVAAVVLALVAAVVPVSSMAPEEAEARQAERPNIVLILTDDMREDEMRRVRRLAKLANSGTTFENAFVTNALCCPSRSTILTGRYAHNHGVFSNSPPIGGWPKFEEEGNARSYLPTWLRSSGYRTGFFGKFLNGYDQKQAPRGWDYWAEVRTSGDAAIVNGNFEGYPKGTYNDDIASEQAVDFVRSDKGSDPMFLSLWLRSPHNPYDPPSRRAHEHDRTRIRRAANLGEYDVSDKPSYVKDEPRRGGNYWQRAIEDRRSRLEMLEAVADNVEQLKNALGREGELEQTYFIFTSDNGILFGEHRLTGKMYPYEESIGVPLTVSGPGVPRGATQEELVVNNDLAPTILSLAGVRERVSVDGRNLKPLLKAGANPPWRDAFLVEHRQDRGDRRAAVPTYEAVRTERHILVRYATGERELYDMANDPQQLNNSYPGADRRLVSELTDRLAALSGCEGTGCRTAEDGATTR